MTKFRIKKYGILIYKRESSKWIIYIHNNFHGYDESLNKAIKMALVRVIKNACINLLDKEY